MHHRFFSCVNAFDTLAMLFRVIRVLSVLVGHRVPNTESECEMRELQTLTLETGTNAKMLYLRVRGDRASFVAKANPITYYCLGWSLVKPWKIK